MIVIGLMSGTSADGVDVGIAEISGAPPALNWKLLHETTIPHPQPLREAILAGMQPETGNVAHLCQLNVALGEQFAQAALTAIQEAGLASSAIDLVGSHGQTVWHAPDDTHPSTLQLGEAAVIAGNDRE